MINLRANKHDNIRRLGQSISVKKTQSLVANFSALTTMILDLIVCDMVMLTELEVWWWCNFPLLPLWLFLSYYENKFTTIQRWSLRIVKSSYPPFQKSWTCHWLCDVMVSRVLCVLNILNTYPIYLQNVSVCEEN